MSRLWLLVFTVLVLGSCAAPFDPNAVREHRCTVVFQTGKDYLREKGEILIERDEIESLTCVQVWASPKKAE